LRLLLNSCRSAEIMLKISTSSIKTLWPKWLRANTKIK
jgi:hypothetical protein